MADPGTGRDAGLPIQEVSRVLAVPAPTLRAWELRYGVPDTPRSAGGHRRYSVEAIQQVRLMRDEIARGRRAADAARAVRTLVAQSGTARDLVDAVLDASDRLAPDDVRATLERAVSVLGLAEAIDQVLMPAMRQVGLWWEAGRCDVAQEHLTSEAARAWVGAVAAAAPAPARARPVVTSAGPRDLHTIGLDAFGALLAHAGWPVRALGARTPPDALRSAVRATDAAAVVVVSHLSSGRRAAVEALVAAEREQVPLFYAGNAFLFTRARHRVPGTYLGESVGAAAKLVDSTVGAGAGGVPVSRSRGRRSRPAPSGRR